MLIKIINSGLLKVTLLLLFLVQILKISLVLSKVERLVVFWLICKHISVHYLSLQTCFRCPN